MLEELHYVHFDQFPEAISRLEDDLGLSDQDSVIGVASAPERRTHYQDELPDPNQSSSTRNDNTIQLKIKKSIHGPGPVKLFAFPPQ
jgi:hypothetical protein